MAVASGTDCRGVPSRVHAITSSSGLVIGSVESECIVVAVALTNTGVNARRAPKDESAVLWAVGYITKLRASWRVGEINILTFYSSLHHHYKR